jgi:hypothetical protein
MRYALAHPAKLLSLLLLDTASAPLELPRSGGCSTIKPLLQGGVKALVGIMKAMPVSPAVQHGIDFLGEADKVFVQPSKDLAAVIPGARL